MEMGGGELRWRFLIVGESEDGRCVCMGGRGVCSFRSVCYFVRGH